jgi:hypothetical protein
MARTDVVRSEKEPRKTMGGSLKRMRLGDEVVVHRHELHNTVALFGFAVVGWEAEDDIYAMLLDTGKDLDDDGRTHGGNGPQLRGVRREAGERTHVDCEP